MKNHWHYVFVAEPIIEVIEKLRLQEIEIDYTKGEKKSGLAMGYFEDNSGLVQSCNIWNKDEVETIFAETGEKPKSCIVLRGSFPDFKRKITIIRKILKIIQDDCKICNQKKEENK